MAVFIKTEFEEIIMVEFIVYEEWGKILCAMNERLITEFVEEVNSKGKKTIWEKFSRANFLDKSIKHLDELRNNLEEAMFKEHPDNADTPIFYGEPHKKE